jgi:hypothetical protein
VTESRIWVFPSFLQVLGTRNLEISTRSGEAIYNCPVSMQVHIESESLCGSSNVS